MAFIPGNTGTSAKAVDGLEGPTAGSPVTFPSGFSGNFVPTALADANATLTSATSVVVMTPTANRVLTLPSSVPSAAFAITVINRSASFTIALNASSGGTVATVGLGQVTVLSTQTNPTTTAHWTISTNGAALQGGNSFGATMLIGTNDNFGIDFETNGTVKASISAAGNLGVGATNPLTKLHVNTAGNTSAGGISLQNAAAQQHFWYLSSNTNSRFEIGSAAGSWDWVNSNGTMLTISAAGAVTLGASGTTGAHNAQGSVSADFQLKVVNSNATNGSGLRVQSGTNTNATTVQSWFGSGTNVGQVTGDGAWTLGPTSGTTVLTHAVNSYDTSGARLVCAFTNRFDDNAYIQVKGTVSTVKFGHGGGQAAITGIHGNTSTGGIAVLINSSGFLGTTTSIRASKTNIQPLSSVSWLYDLEPVSFNYRKKVDGVYTEEAEDHLNFGLIADDVVAVKPEIAFSDKDGVLSGVAYERLITPMLKAIQELNAKIEAQAQEIQLLKGGN